MSLAARLSPFFGRAVSALFSEKRYAAFLEQVTPNRQQATRTAREMPKFVKKSLLLAMLSFRIADALAAQRHRPDQPTGRSAVRHLQALKGLSNEQRAPELKALARTGEAKEVEDHPFLTLLSRNVPELPGRDLRQMSHLHYELTGEAIWARALLRKRGQGARRRSARSTVMVLGHPARRRWQLRARFQTMNTRLEADDVPYLSGRDPENPGRSELLTGWYLRAPTQRSLRVTPTWKTLRSATLLTLITLLPMAHLAAQSKPAAGPVLDSEEKKILYAIGLAVGQNLGALNFSAAEFDLVRAGINDAALKSDPKVSLQEYGPKLQAFVQERQAAAAAAAAAGEKVEADKFLARMAAEQGAVVKPSGLIISPITAGTGASPLATDRVTVHYHGTLRDGSVFDSSRDRGQPATFGLNQVIPCWTEGLQLMKVGGKSKLVCPSAIAYGDQGRPPVIPPGAALVFEVELLSIGEPEAPSQP